MKMNDFDECKIIQLPRHASERGVITEVQNDDTVLFPIRRVFYLYDVPSDSQRGAHAHRNDHELIVAAAGSFEVLIHDGRQTKTFTLHRPYEGLHVPPGLWLQLKNFSSGSIALVMVSNHFSEEDYIRNYDDYLQFVEKK